MSLLIKGMKMPKACWDCFADNALAQNIAYFEAICPFTERFVTFSEFDAKSGRHPECPLFEVPTPHGRLVDADALKATFCAECNHTITCEDCDIDYHIERLAPTIIEAEEGEAHEQN